MGDYHPGMQKARLADVESDAHGLMSKRTAALVVSGALGVRMADGSEEVFSAGDVMLLPPGHDAWSVGDEACRFVEFSRGNDYYAA
jgi:hypothetical protein